MRTKPAPRRVLALVLAAGARAFAGFLVRPATQAVIARFGVEKIGAPLFVPDAGKDPAALGL